MVTSHYVLIVGIDGVRFDTLASASTPRLDGLAARGFLRPVPVNPAVPTISGPCWTTMVTGVLAPDHRVFGNNLAGHRILEYPDVLTRCRAAGLSTCAVATWAPLVTATDGGPIFLGRGLMPSADPGKDVAASEAADEAVTADACRVLGGHDCPSAGFVYLATPDVTAHAVGVGPAYAASIERADRCLGQILDAVAGRPSYASEAWTIIVATDHGHVDAGGHGGDSPEERTAWIAAAGPSLPPAAPTLLEQSDVAAHTLHALGIGIDPRWRLHGVPFGGRG